MSVGLRSTVGGRRRAFAVASIGVALLAIGSAHMLSAFASGAPSRPVDRSLSSYVLFAFDSLDFKGGTIAGGDVGANGVDANPADSNPIVSICANHPVTMDAGSQLVGDSMRVTSDCSVWDVFANHLTAGSDVVPQNSGPTQFVTPIIAGPPPFPSFDCGGGAPVDVPKNGSLTLAPDVYGAVTVGDGASLTLSAGTYTMCDFNVGRNATVTTAPGVVLQIAQQFIVSNGTSFGPDCTVPVYVRGDGVGSNDNTINFAKNTDINGHFLTLLGKLALGDSTQLTGQFVANEIVSDEDVHVHPCGGGGTTTTSSSSTTTTVPETTASTSTTSTSSTSSTTTTTVPETTTSTSSTTVPETTSSTSTTSTSTSTTSTTSTPSTTTSTTTPESSSSTSTTTLGGQVPRLTTSTTVEAATLAVPSTTTTLNSPNEPESLPRTGGGTDGSPLAFAFVVIGAALIGLGRRRSRLEVH